MVKGREFWCWLELPDREACPVYSSMAEVRDDGFKACSYCLKAIYAKAKYVKAMSGVVVNTL